MAPSLSESRAPRRLSALLDETPWSAEAGLRLVRSLARQIHQRHEDGRLHGAVTADAVRLGEGSEPLVEPAAAAAARPRFGGQFNDPDVCPPFLADEDVLELPETIPAAAALFQQKQFPFDPRQIDLYQLGTLLCRLVTGKSVLVYMYDPRAKAALPRVVQAVLERLLASGPGEGFSTCGQLAEAIDEALESLGADGLHGEAAAGGETPARGSVLRAAADDTPARGHRPAGPRAEESSPDDGGELPFRRLGIYTIVSRIGGGGMGDVYLARDESLDRPVALKVLPADLARDKEFVQRFRAEAAAAAKVVHPNVVPIYSIDEDAGHHFFSMHYVDGESLASRLSRRKRLPPSEAVELVRQCLAGLGAAHAAGLIHRDVKPGNILIERATGRVTLVDFGLVRRLGESARMTATGVIMGTVDYIAPEQARGKQVDGRTDLYSLGVMFYQILSGCLPFEAETPTAMIFQHAYEAPRLLSELAPETPEALAAIVARLMAKDPADRYQDAQSVLADLDRFGSKTDGPLEAIVVDEASEKPPEDARGAVTTPPPPSAEPFEAALPEQLRASIAPRAWRPIRDWAATMFRRHSPQFVQELQSTTQQVDAAVAEYERRRERLARLEEEARGVAAELSNEIEENRRAARLAEAKAASAADEDERRQALAQRDACRQRVEAMAEQLERQKEQLEDIESQASRADATLARLRSQRDLLKARWKAVEARTRSPQGRPASSRRRRRIAFWAAVGACCLGAAFLIMLVSRFSLETAGGKAGAGGALPGGAAGAIALRPPTPLPPGSVSGSLFEDLNSDGVRDAGEPALAGWTVELRPVGREGKLLRTFRASTQGLGNYVVTAGDNVIIAAVDDVTAGKGAGAVFVFDGATGKQLRKILNPEPGIGEKFGHEIAASGEDLLVGVPWDDALGTDAGTAYLFDISNGKLRQSYALPEPTDSARAGYGVALLDDIVAVGAPGTPTSPFSGAVYLYDRWSGQYLRTLANPTPQRGDCFGAHMAEVNGNLLVGAANDDTMGTDAGAAYLFDPASGNLLRTFFRPAQKRAAGDFFGFSTVNLGGYAAVSTPGYDGRVEDCGVIYLFDTQNGSPVATFQNPAPGSNSRFGTSMAAVGGDLLVGCPNDAPDGQTNVGAAYLLDGSTGAALLTLPNPSPEDYDFFGWSVAAMGNNLLVTANHDNTDSAGNGTVYLFEGAPQPSTTVTDGDGRYHFDDVEGGAYQICCRLPKGYWASSPNKAVQTILIGGRQDLSQVDFAVSAGSAGNALSSLAPGMAAGLRYDFQPGERYVYETRIEADLPSAKQTTSGHVTYTVTSVDPEKGRMTLSAAGSLGTTSQPKPGGHGFPYRPPGYPGPPRPFFPFATSLSDDVGYAREVTIDRSGEVLQYEGGGNLPCVLGPVALLMIDPMPPQGQKSWSVDGNVDLFKTQESDYYRSPMFSRPTQTRWTSRQNADYTLAGADGDLAVIRKTYRLVTDQETDGKPLLEQVGHGEIRFDVKAGVPASLEMEYSITVHDEGVTVGISTTLKTRLLSKSEAEELRQKKEAELAAAKERAAEAARPKPIDDAELDQVLSDIAKGDDKKVQDAVKRLALAIPIESRRREVAAALETVLERRARMTASNAVKALGEWGSEENVPALVKAVGDGSVFLRRDAISAVTKFPTPEAAGAVAGRLRELSDRENAVQALQQMGPVAEEPVLPILEDSDVFTRAAACRVLAEVGTSKSLEPLKKLLVSESNGMVGDQAKKAVAAIEGRQ